MKLNIRTPEIPGAVIAVFAMVLGGMITASLFLSRLPSGDRPRFVSSPLLGVAGIGAVALLVFAVVVLRALKDRELRADRDLLAAFLEHIPDNVFFKDRDSRFVRVGRAMANYFGLSEPEQALHKRDSDMFSSEHAAQAFADEQDIIRTGQPMIGMEEKETWPDGRESWVLTTKVPLKDRRGQIIGTMGIARDITDRKQAESRIRYMALHDALTGLPNRTLLEDRLNQAITLACRNRQRVAVFMLDLDHFKSVNDSLGHYLGDRLLEEVSVRLRGCLRESDIVARLGGDEFVIGVPIHDHDQNVELVAQKVQAALTQPFHIEGHELRIGASIGICQYPADGENSKALLQIADAAMYQAKQNKRGAYCLFTPELTEATRRRQKLEIDLKQALALDQFVLHYQPLIAAASGRVTGVEALLRWRHPEQGLISPNQFIPLLEELGLMVDVGRWVLRTACFQNAAWQKQGYEPIRMAVNLSTQQFYRSNIVSTVESALRDSGLDPRWLELELTESLTLDDSETTVRIMLDLKRVGVSLSLDDFGTGWSSLAYLRQFPLDRLKIDRSFLRDIATQPTAEAVVRSILNLGRDLGLACVAEGVETAQQLDYLQNQRCSEVQGFLYSPAVPASDCAALFRTTETAMEAPFAPGNDNRAAKVRRAVIARQRVSKSVGNELEAPASNLDLYASAE